MRPHVLTILQRVADGDAAAVNECLEGKQAGTCRKLPTRAEPQLPQLWLTNGTSPMSGQHSLDFPFRLF